MKWTDRYESDFQHTDSRRSDALRHESVESPDLTEDIMHRLGYEQGSSETRRRLMIWRWLRRGATVCLLFAMFAFGAYVHQWSDTVRKPVGPTIHSAMSRDIESRSNALGDAIRNFGARLVPQTPVMPAAEADEPCVKDNGKPCQNQSRVPWSGLL